MLFFSPSIPIYFTLFSFSSRRVSFFLVKNKALCYPVKYPVFKNWATEKLYTLFPACSFFFTKRSRKFNGATKQPLCSELPTDMICVGKWKLSCIFKRNICSCEKFSRDKFANVCKINIWERKRTESAVEAFLPKASRKSFYYREKRLVQDIFFFYSFVSHLNLIYFEGNNC